MIGGFAQNIKSANTTYFGVYIASITGLPANNTETNVQTALPLNCTLSNFYVYLNNSPGGTASYTFIIRKNGVNTALSVTISGGSITGSDLVDTVSFTSGDLFSISAVPSGGPNNDLEVSWVCRVTSI